MTCDAEGCTSAVKAEAQDADGWFIVKVGRRDVESMSEWSELDACSPACAALCAQEIASEVSP